MRPPQQKEEETSHNGPDDDQIGKIRGTDRIGICPFFRMQRGGCRRCFGSGRRNVDNNLLTDPDQIWIPDRVPALQILHADAMLRSHPGQRLPRLDRDDNRITHDQPGIPLSGPVHPGGHG